MKSKNNNLVINMLETALEMEQRGHKFYTRSARETNNPLVRKVFNTLAKDEIFHIKAIKKFYSQSLKSQVKLNMKDALHKKNTKAVRAKKIFDVAVEKWRRDISLSKDDNSAYKFALNFESKGYEFYKKSLQKAKEENLKKVLIFLTKQENEHYCFLQETYEYLVHPANWFIKEEKPIYEGG